MVGQKHKLQEKIEKTKTNSYLFIINRILASKYYPGDKINDIIFVPVSIKPKINYKKEKPNFESKTEVKSIQNYKQT